MKTVALKRSASPGRLTGCAMLVLFSVAVGLRAESQTPKPLANTLERTDASNSGVASSSQDKAANKTFQLGVSNYSLITEVVKLKEAGVANDVIQAHVTQSPSPYPPSASEIIYLHDHGITPEIITALIRGSATARAQAQPATQASPNAASQPAPEATAPIIIQQPAYSQVAAPVASSYSYTNPYYYYYYYDYPGFSYRWPYSFWWSSPAVYYNSYPHRGYAHWPAHSYHYGAGRSLGGYAGASYSYGAGRNLGGRTGSSFTYSAGRNFGGHSGGSFTYNAGRNFGGRSGGSASFHRSR
jgi:hypothetical protein